MKKGGGCCWTPRDPPERLSMSCQGPFHAFDITALMLKGNFFGLPVSITPSGGKNLLTPEGSKRLSRPIPH